VAASLTLGVERSQDALEAHAWVVYAGQVIADRADVAQRYVGHFVSPPGRLSFLANDPAGPGLKDLKLR